MTQIRGPSPLELVAQLRHLRRDLLGCLLDWRARYGDVIKVPLTRPRIYQISHPDDIKHVLVSNALNYEKTGGLMRGRTLFGRGLLTSEEPLHTRQRRIIQPSLHRQRVASFIQVMTDVVAERLETWKNGQALDMVSEMTHVTLTIIGKSMLSSDLSADTGELTRALTMCLRYLQGSSVIILPDWIQRSRHRAYRSAVTQIDELIYRLIAERRAAVERPDDLLTLLLESRYDDGSRMSDEQIRDEIVTIFLAGHETTANALSWTWYLLSQHPDADRYLRQEIDSVLGDRPPRAEDLAGLRYTSSVIAEAMRLYPPAWIVARRAMDADTLPTGARIPKRADVVIIVYVVHRNPRYFPDPERFDPERFLRAGPESLPAHAYLPFGAGRRGCVGESFAKTEAAVLTAMIAQKFRLHLEPGQIVVPEALLTLRPKHGLLMRVEARQD
jgi:cytochrome P450